MSFSGFFDRYGKDIKSLGILAVVILAVRSTIICPYTVPTGSMEPTIKAGDRIFVNKMSYNFRIPFTMTAIIELAKPVRGDIIAFKYPVNPDIDYIKRVIGLPGDTIRIQGDDIFVNGARLPMVSVSDRSLLNEISDQQAQFKEIFEEDLGSVKHIVIKNPPMMRKQTNGEWKVPADHYFVMGDNRDNSLDSRWWKFVPHNYVHGRALFTFFSLLWPESKTFPSVRLDRFFHTLK